MGAGELSPQQGLVSPRGVKAEWRDKPFKSKGLLLGWEEKGNDNGGSEEATSIDSQSVSLPMRCVP